MGPNAQIQIRNNIKNILEILEDARGRDTLREGIRETPERVAKAFTDELFRGYDQDPMDVFKTFEVEVESGDMVILRDLPVYSTCEHHLLPFIGKAHIAYIPGEQVLGLSKFARLIDVFGRRLQVQERLTKQVADALMEGLDPQGVIVIIEAEHMCMTIRGVQAPGTMTLTSAIRGCFVDDIPARQEALSLINRRTS